jgi:1-acyl-sn-glycerol-3-phosphate acyltransferase
MLWRLRVLSFYIIISILCIVFFLGSYIPIKIFNVKYHTKYKFAVIFSHAFIWLAKSICGLKYDISGLEKLPAVPCIVLANHQSFWDNVLMQLIIPEHSWVIKKELFNIPFFGWGLKLFDPIAVDRTDNASVNQILREGQKKLQNGLWLIIFPESTRLRPEQETKFKPSAVKLASIAKVPIVLMAHNAGVYWPKGFWIKKPGTIKVKIIDIIPREDIEKFDVRFITEQAQQVINTEKQVLFEQATKAKIGRLIAG